MAELRTEEEQVEALKNWWRENGKTLVLGVALAVALVFGWRGWQNQQAVKAENASVQYQNLLDASFAALGPQKSDAQLKTAQHLANELKSEYAGDAYANYAALILARIAVEQGELDTALTELDWVLAQEPGADLQVLTQLRKARVLAAKGELDQAFTLLQGMQITSFAANYFEVLGDIQLAMGDQAAARTSYQNAIAQGEAGSRQPIVQMKLNDLATEEG